MYTGVLLVMATFTGFNPVLFRVYQAWLTPFIPMVACDFMTQGTPGSAPHG